MKGVEHLHKFALTALLGAVISAQVSGLGDADKAMMDHSHRPPANATEELCVRMAKFTSDGGPRRVWAMGANNDASIWYSSAAMPQLGAVEIARLFPTKTLDTRRWASTLLDKWLQPGQPAVAGLAGARWSHWCDRNGVPPTLFVALRRGTALDRKVILAFANQTLEYPSRGKVDGASVLPNGAVARSSGGSWRVPLPRENLTVITWPDDCFMCTAMLSHAAPAVRAELGTALLDEAARRLLAVIESGQRDHTDGLLWHGFDAASGAHSCCKWGDGNGWYFMAAADALRGPSLDAAIQERRHPGSNIPPLAEVLCPMRLFAGFQLTNHTGSQYYGRLHSVFRAFASSWLNVQRPSGMWSQLLDDHNTFESSSATGFGLYSLATGMRIGVLRGTDTSAAIQRGWNALLSYIQPDGSVTGLSNGFGILDSKTAYLRRTNSSLLWGYGAVLRACAAVSSL
eukprot:COSAG02_NODE_1016_length_15190_cov_128.667418_14_plen_457_part_00